MFGPQYNNYGAMVEFWHQLVVDQITRGEPVWMPYGLNHLGNAPQPIGETREGIQEEPRPHTLEAMPEGRAPLEWFNDQLDQALLLVDYIQTKARVFELINELEIMMEKLVDITLGLEQSSTCGTH